MCKKKSLSMDGKLRLAYVEHWITLLPTGPTGQYVFDDLKIAHSVIMPFSLHRDGRGTGDLACRAAKSHMPVPEEPVFAHDMPLQGCFCACLGACAQKSTLMEWITTRGTTRRTL